MAEIKTHVHNHCSSYWTFCWWRSRWRRRRGLLKLPVYARPDRYQWNLRKELNKTRISDQTGPTKECGLNIFFSFPRFHSPPPTPNLSEIYCKEVGQRTGRKIFDLQRLSPIFWWNRTETDLSIWLSTEISGILCWHTMKSTGSLHTDSVLINKSPQNWKTVVLSANYASIVLNSGYLWKGWILQS